MSSSAGATGRRFLAETAALVGAALVCAFVSNALAGRERKLQAVGRYPNALTVPAAAATAAAAAAPADAAPAPAAPSASAASAAPSPSVPAAVPASPAVAPSPSAPAKAPAPASAQPAGPKPASAPPAPSVPASSRASDADLLARFPAAPDKVFREVGGADAAWLFAQGVPFLDARRTKVYEEGHVAGARPFPVWESDIDQRVLAIVNEGRRTDLPLVLYCSGGECEDSHMLAERLFAAGFVNLLVYRDGYPDWQKRGGAVRTGPNP